MPKLSPLLFLFGLFILPSVLAQMGPEWCPVEAPSELVGCKNGPTITDQPHVASYSLDLRTYDQYALGPPGLQRVSCVPAAAASLMDYVNETLFLGITGDYTEYEYVLNLAHYMFTMPDGTSSDNALFGMMQFLDYFGLLDNFTYHYYASSSHDHFLVKDLPVPDSRPFIGGTMYTWTNAVPNYTSLYDEFVQHRGLVVLGVNITYYLRKQNAYHSFAVDNLDNVLNKHGGYNISFMDPAFGVHVYGTMHPNGTIAFPSLYPFAVMIPRHMQIVRPR